MKKIFLILPAIAFAVLLLNGFYGHSLFASPYDQDINKYSIYVHFQEEWNSFPVNVLFEITNVWSNPNPNDHVYSTDFSNVSNFDNYNYSWIIRNSTNTLLTRFEHRPANGANF